MGGMNCPALWRIAALFRSLVFDLPPCFLLLFSVSPSKSAKIIFFFLAHMASDRSIEKSYRKVTPVEHVLLRPEMYIGSVENVQMPCWCCRPNFQMEHREVSVNQGLLKIFDEILLNASDNYYRSLKKKQKMTYIDVSVSDRGIVKVKNDGVGIPVCIHKDHNVYVPELVFGHMLTSTNYTKDDGEMTAGRHGFGAKLTNILSKKFYVETQCKGQCFEMTWTDHMKASGAPKVTTHSGKDYTLVEFTPDYDLFHCSGLSEDMRSTFMKRLVDLASTFPDLSLKWNGQLLPFGDFEKYVKLYAAHSTKTYFYTTEAGRGKCKARIGLVMNPLSHRAHVGIVNGVVTPNGGTHLTHFLKQIGAAAEKISTSGMLNVRQLLSQIVVIVNVKVANAKFDSQSKVRLVSEHPFPKLEADEIKEFLKSLPTFKSCVATTADVLEKVMDNVKTHRGSKAETMSIPKLTDAVQAGNGTQFCTLIVTEGDSAKALAVSALSAEQRQTFGVFPLRGKVLNVRNAGKHVASNKELHQLFVALGLQISNKKPDPKELRYQRLMIMADQDHDGSHIRGLIINAIDCFWPSLLDQRFVCIFRTPLLKVFPAEKEAAPLMFFTQQELDKWKEHSTSKKDRYKIKYYKGLGTSTAEEGREYFNDLRKHVISVSYDDKKAAARLDLQNIFDEKNAEWRKQWIQGVNILDMPVLRLTQEKEESHTTVSNFLHQELIHYATAACHRALPSAVDGLKPSQRKVLWGCFRRNLVTSLKVAQLSGYIAENAAYHHGEASLQGTIVNLAQDYVGSNNVNYLIPEGQFGTRLNGGSDSAAARYIFTKLNPLTRMLFPAADDSLLEYAEDDGVPVEPIFYRPILPTIFINGSVGISVGFAVDVPPHNPLDLSALIREMLAGQKARPIRKLLPWATGFLGTTTINDSEECRSSFMVHGKYTLHKIPASRANVTVRVLDIPFCSSLQTFKENLIRLMEKKEIDSFHDFSSGTAVDFEVVVRSSKLRDWHQSEGGIEEKLGLVRPLSINCCCFDREGNLKEWNANRSAIVSTFFEARMETYVKRRVKMLERLSHIEAELEGLMMFVQDLRGGKLNLTKLSEAEVVEYFRSHKYPVGDYADASDSGDGPLTQAKAAPGYKYLLNRSIVSITKVSIESKQRRLEEIRKEIVELKKTSPTNLWINDLNAFDAAFTEFERRRREAILAQHSHRKVTAEVQLAQVLEHIASLEEKRKATEDAKKEEEVESQKPSEKKRKGVAPAEKTAEKAGVAEKTAVAPPALKVQAASPVVKFAAAVVASALHRIVGHLLV